MLAPRDTLWSAPSDVVNAALELLSASETDVVADFGCGDGVALLEAVQTRGCARAVGYEINVARVEDVQRRVCELGLEHRVRVRACNALDAAAFFDEDQPTCVYLYLIERGLKLMLPVLQELARRQADGILRVVTVLYRMPEGAVGPPARVVRYMHTPTHMYPLYLYHIRAPAASSAAPE